MAIYNIGRVAYVNRGNYSPTFEYQKMDVAQYNNGSYLFTSETPSSGKIPTNYDYWQPMLDPTDMNLATQVANSAAINATTKAGNAGDAAALANEKAGLANTAADNANSKANLANTAATNANDKAGLANTAATNANNKAGLANDAAALANTKAGEANTAANLANEKAALADEKAGLANTASLNANEQEELRDAAEGLRAGAEISRNSSEGLRQTAETNRIALHNKWSNPEAIATTLAPESPATAEVVIGAEKVTLNIGVPEGIQGEQGYSAYEVWEQSNAGKTEDEYIAFLKQEALASAQAAETAAVNANSAATNATSNMLWRRLTTNPASFYPVPQSPLYVRASGEPIQSGIGDPAPDNIRPILPWKAEGETVKVQRTTNNLFVQPAELVTEIVDGVECLTGSACIIPTIGFKPNTYYTIIAKGKYRNGFGYRLRIDYTDGTFDQHGGSFSTSFGDMKLVSNSSKIISHFSFSDFAGANNVVLVKDSIRILEGAISMETPYEPYYGNEITTLTAPQDIYGGWMDNEGNGQVDVYMHRLTGLENVEPSTIQTLAARFNITLNPSVSFSQSVGSGSVSSHFVRIGTGTDIERFAPIERGITLLYIFKSRLTGWDDEWTYQQKIDAAKAYFAAQYAAGTPITFAMKLSNSVSITPAAAPLLALPQADRITPRLNVVATDAPTLRTDYAKSPIQESNEQNAAIVATGV